VKHSDSHSHPATRVARPMQRPLVPIHLQLVCTYNFVGHIKLGMGTLTTNSMDTTLLEHIQAIETSASSEVSNSLNVSKVHL
jgi:hypothetical protein